MRDIFEDVFKDVKVDNQLFFLSTNSRSDY